MNAQHFFPLATSLEPQPSKRHSADCLCADLSAGRCRPRVIRRYAAWCYVHPCSKRQGTEARPLFLGAQLLLEIALFVRRRLFLAPRRKFNLLIAGEG